MSDSESSIGHVFDQTNGVIDDVDGDSDGTAASDTASAAERTSGDDDVRDDVRADDDAALRDEGAASPAGGVARDTASTSPTGGVDAGGREAAPADRSGTGDDGPDYAPPADLPLPGEHAQRTDASGRGAGATDRTGAVDGAGADGGAATTRPGGADRPAAVAADDDAAYSEAPEVAQRSAADDGRAETSTRDGGGEQDRSVTDAHRDGPRDEVAGDGAAEDPGSLDVGHVFDQTNGVVDDLDGDSDGTAGSDEASAAERGDAV